MNAVAACFSTRVSLLSHPSLCFALLLCPLHYLLDLLNEIRSCCTFLWDDR